jgi:purine-cytosine permease-like protein
MAIPYLIAAFGGLLLSNHLSVYSAGLTTLTLGVRIRRVYAVTVDVVVTFAGSIYFMLLAGSFYGPFISFISLLAIPITAWLAVFLVDMIKRRWYDPVALLDMRGGRYWYRGGFEWRAIGAWALAIVVGYVLLSAGQGGIAWIVTFVVAAAVYAVLGGAKGQLTDPTPEPAAETVEAARG